MAEQHRQRAVVLGTAPFRTFPSGPVNRSASSLPRLVTASLAACASLTTRPGVCSFFSLLATEQQRQCCLHAVSTGSVPAERDAYLDKYCTVPMSDGIICCASRHHKCWQFAQAMFKEVPCCRFAVRLNKSGLPMREGLDICSHYARTGTCKFGASCKFHHPNPAASNEEMALWPGTTAPPRAPQTDFPRPILS